MFVDLCHVVIQTYVRHRNLPPDSVIKRSLVMKSTEESLKICLVAGYYLPNSGYLESQLAFVLSELGHRVTVFTSGLKPFSVPRSLVNKMQKRESRSESCVTVVELPPLVKFRAHFFSKGLCRAVNLGRFDLILVIGVGQCFGVPALSAEHWNGSLPKKIAVFGDNEAQEVKHGFKRFLKKYIFNLTKAPLYRFVCRRSDFVYATTENGRSWISENFCVNHHKAKLLPLSYDRKQFYFSESLRVRVREELEVEDGRKIYIFSGKITEKKRVSELVDLLGSSMSQGDLFLIVGDDEQKESKRIRELAERQAEIVGEIRFMGQCTQLELNMYFNAADIGIWHRQPAISIQQALGTGLFCVLPSNSYVNHLLCEETGAYFRDKDMGHLSRVLNDVATRVTLDVNARRSREQVNRKFSSRNVAEMFLNDVFD